MSGMVIILYHAVTVGQWLNWTPWFTCICGKTLNHPPYSRTDWPSAQCCHIHTDRLPRDCHVQTDRLLKVSTYRLTICPGLPPTDWPSDQCCHVYIHCLLMFPSIDCTFYVQCCLVHTHWSSAYSCHVRTDRLPSVAKYGVAVCTGWPLTYLQYTQCCDVQTDRQWCNLQTGRLHRVAKCRSVGIYPLNVAHKTHGQYRRGGNKHPLILENHVLHPFWFKLWFSTGRCSALKTESMFYGLRFSKRFLGSPTDPRGDGNRLLSHRS